MRDETIQADRVFPIKGEIPEGKDWREQMRQTGYLPGENDWRKTGPLAVFWKLPEPLRTLALAAVTLGGIFLLAWEASRSGRKRD